MLSRDRYRDGRDARNLSKRFCYRGREQGFNLLECMLALCCMLLVMSSMQALHSQLLARLRGAQIELHQYWLMRDLHQRLQLYSSVWQPALESMASKQLSLGDIQQEKNQCMASCDTVEALYAELGDWQRLVDSGAMSFASGTSSDAWLIRKNTEHVVLELMLGATVSSTPQMLTSEFL